MSISRIQAIETENNVPKVDIDSTVNNVPKFPVDLQGGASPIDLQSISISENGTTEAPEGVAYNEIVVDVPQTTLTSITITENGTTTAPSGTAYNEIVVDVPPVEPTIKVVSEYDFSVAQYDIIRSINPTTPTASNKALLNAYLYNASYDSTNGVVSWVNGYGNVQPYIKFNMFKDYEIEIHFGDVQNSSSGNREFFGIGTQMRLYWNTTDSCVRRSNSSGNENWVELNSLDCIKNKKLIVKCEWRVASGTNTPTSYWSVKFEDEENYRFLGNCDYTMLNDLIIGRCSSQNGLFPMEVKYIKVIEKKWTIDPNRNIENDER